MSVTWGDMKSVTWGEMHKAGMTWGDAKTLTSREYFVLLEKRLCALERELDAAPKEKRKNISFEILLSAISIALGIVTAGLAVDAKRNPVIQREEVVSMMQNIEIIADAAQRFLEEPQQESLDEAEHDIEEERPK